MTSKPSKYVLCFHTIKFFPFPPNAHLISFPDLPPILKTQQAQKLRLDSFLSSQLPEASRARLQASIKEGLVTINGNPTKKPASLIHTGDIIVGSLLPPPPLEACPEPIPLDIIYEDHHVLVVNKPAGMVTHPAPGNYTGTLVNAVLHHCGLGAVQFGTVSLEGQQQLPLEEDDDDDDGDDGDGDNIMQQIIPNTPTTTIIRPGIVHRLDKGTTGLLVVAKTDKAHQSLSQQFKDRTVTREYWSLTLNQPTSSTTSKPGRVATNIGRDLRDRKKMATFAYESAQGRTAASTYTILETLLNGAVSLVSWKLETGRTHQIRVHAKHVGCPLIGDDVYGGGAGVVAESVMTHSMRRKKKNDTRTTTTTKMDSPSTNNNVGYYKSMVESLGRPALHAKTLGFQHPESGERVYFESELPDDFQHILDGMRKESI